MSEVEKGSEWDVQSIFSFFLFLKRSNTNKFKDSHIIVRFSNNIRPQSRSLSLYPLSSFEPPISVRSVPFGPRMAYHLTSSCLCFSVSLFLPRLTHARTHTPSRLYIAFPHDVTRLSRRGTNTARGSQSIRRDAARRDVLN